VYEEKVAEYLNHIAEAEPIRNDTAWKGAVSRLAHGIGAKKLKWHRFLRSKLLDVDPGVSNSQKSLP
jgi:hypothetical protein